MEKREPIRRTDDQLLEILDQSGTWVIHGSSQIFGVATTLRRALNKADTYAKSDAVVTAIARPPPIKPSSRHPIASCTALKEKPLKPAIAVKKSAARESHGVPSSDDGDHRRKLIDFRNARPPWALTLPSIDGTSAHPISSSRLNVTAISRAREGGRDVSCCPIRSLPQRSIAPAIEAIADIPAL